MQSNAFMKDRIELQMSSESSSQMICSFRSSLLFDDSLLSWICLFDFSSALSVLQWLF